MRAPPLFRQRARKRGQTGLTLIELMIGLVIGLIVIGAVLYVFLGSRLTYKYNDAMGRIQENGRIAIDMISQDLRMTGFIGCRRLWAHLPAANTGSIAARSIYFSSGFNAAIESSLGLPAGSLDLGRNGFIFSPAIPTQLANTDSVMVLGGTREIPLAEFMANEADDVTASSTVPEGPAIISDCRFDSLPLSDNSPTGVPAPAEGFMVTAAGTTITHSEFQRAYATDASITPISPISYSIRETGNRDNTGNFVRSLFRNDDELIEGVRDLCVRYGLATNSSNNAVGEYVEAPEDDEWQRVVSVRIELLLASVDDLVVDALGDVPLLCANVGVPRPPPDPPLPPDRRMYTVFTATVSLRNQIVSD